MKNEKGKMKKEKTMNESLSLKVFFGVLVLVLLAACDNPFKSGLGTRKDLEYPVVTLDRPDVGAYLRGSITLTGSASDDYKLQTVKLRITYPAQIELLENGDPNPYWGDINLSRDSKNKWSFDLDTTMFPNGDFKIQLEAVDSVPKVFTSNEYAFFIKNDTPEIVMSQPAIEEGKEEGQAGSDRLNFDYLQDPLSPFPKNFDARSMFEGSFLVGMVRDGKGIYYSGNPEPGKFNPQIRFWRVNDMSNSDDREGFEPGVYPGEDEVEWENFVLDNNLFMLDAFSYQFVYQLPNAAGNYYAFEIRAQSTDGDEDNPGTAFHYPTDYYTAAAPDYFNYRANIPNRAVLIYISAEKSPPQLTLRGLEDITGPNGWNSVAKEYNIIEKNGIPLDGNVPHPYVDGRSVTKNGAFTLRIKASHPDGIGAAEVFWKRDDNYKGYFIWDPAVLSYAGWDQNYNNVPIGNNFTSWGLRDPYEPTVTQLATRNFIFTYNDHYYNPASPADRIPDETQYHAGARGKSKIQQYTGVAIEEWQNINSAEWTDMDYLEDGTYEIYARATSGGLFGTRGNLRYMCTITIDRHAPEIIFNAITGGFVDSDLIPLPHLTNTPAYTVNGVVRPVFRFSDEGRGIRQSDAPYFDGNEQRYILIPDANKIAFDTAMADAKAGDKYWWPEVPANRFDPLTVFGVNIPKHDRIGGSSFFLKTSPIYDDNSEAESPASPLWKEKTALPDKSYYWLYVFARDRAFNVGQLAEPVLIYVDYESDKPKVNFNLSSVEQVLQPSAEFDFPNSASGEGFAVDNGSGGARIRNRLPGNANVRLRITDDDGFVSGASGVPPGNVTVTFSGSRLILKDPPDSQNPFKVEELDEMTLTHEDTAKVFNVTNQSRELLGNIDLGILLDHFMNNQVYNYLFGAPDTESVSPIPPDSVKHNFDRLPDGIYKISVKFNDDSAKKLRTESDSGDPESLENTAEFWFVVDSAPPTIDNSINPPTNSYITATNEVIITGKVTDRNGPVKVRSFTVSPARTTGSEDVSFGSPTLAHNLIGNNLETDFTAGFNLNGNSGTFTVTLQFEDRFGSYNNPRTLTYSVDTEPPAVSFRKIETFSRNGIIVTPGDIQAGLDVNVYKESLVNKVISFTVNANDASGVQGIRWWLLPIDVSSNETAMFSTPPASGHVTGYGAFPSDDPASVAPPEHGVYYLDGTNGHWGAYGEVDMANRKFTIAIDTDKLSPKNGVYSLHIIARDNAGNDSVAGAEGQTIPRKYQDIFVLQEEDKPYVSIDSPRAEHVVGDTGLVIRGVISDDDGFGPYNDNTPIWPETVKISFSKTSPADPNNPADYEYTRTVTNGLTRQGKDVNLNVNLLNRSNSAGLFTPAEIGTDGIKYYLIEAWDAPVNKINTDGTKDDTSRVSRRGHFSFVYDTLPPVISLSNPTLNQAFGDNNKDDPDYGLFLKGHMEDVNLAKNDNGNYYFKYRLDSWPQGTEPKEFELTNGTPPTGHIVSENLVTGRVDFWIPATVVTDDMLDFTSLNENTHTLTLLVEDSSGKDGSYMVNFIKDGKAPTFTFVNIDPIPLASNWWSGSLTAQQKHNWLNDNPAVSTIYYFSGERPVLSGIFEDDISNINMSSIEYWIDDDEPDNPGRTNITTDGSGRSVPWSIYLTIGGAANGQPLPDGVHSVRLKVADVSGNVNPVPPDVPVLYAFRIDSTPPEITLDNQEHSVFGTADGFSGVDPIFTISGTANDPNLKDVRLRIVDTVTNQDILGPAVPPSNTPSGVLLINPATPDGNIVTPVWTYPAGIPKVAWGYRVTKTLYETLTNGRSYNVIATAIDTAPDFANVATEAVWTFTVDMVPPEIDIESYIYTPLGDLTPSQLNTANSNVFSGSNLSIQGGVEDKHSAIAGLQSMIEYWDYEGNPSDNLNNWKPKQDWTNIITLTNNKSQSLSWRKDLSSTGLDLDQGLYRMRVRAKDSSWIDIGDDDYGSTGRGNPVTSDYIYFFYDRSGPVFNLGSPLATWYSSRRSNGTLSFTGSVSDPNRFRSVAADVYKDDGSPSGIQRVVWPPASQDLNYGASTQTWTLNLNVPYGEQAGAIPDGYYKITFTATDMAGGIEVFTGSFTLDNTPPTGSVTAPAKPAPANQRPGHPEASVIVMGGETAEITGTTNDTSSNRTESGINPGSMWFHLGYVGSSLDFLTPTTIAQTVLNNSNLTDSGAHNGLFDTAAKAPNNAWFKLENVPSGGTREYPVPAGFTIPNANIYDWRMVIPNDPTNGGNGGGLKQYADISAPITVKGIPYYAPYPNGPNPADPSPNGPKMVRPVPEAEAGQAGIYSLPLWVRIVDNVGNVSYFCRDIWIYPDGDIPSTTINNPSSADRNSARGGSISADGVASNNTSIYSIIYRVKADDVSTTTPENIGVGPNTAPDDTRIVTFDTGTPLAGSGDTGAAKMISDLMDAGYTAATTAPGWYFATMQAGRGSATVPWDFIFNTNEEITGKIADWGFYSATGTSVQGSNDTIRVWLEVFVFNGESAPIRISINDGSVENPRPYARVFYIKSSSPSIPRTMISTIDNKPYYETGVSTPYFVENGIYYQPYSLSGVGPRRGKFSIRAELDAASGSTLGQISVRRPDETVNTDYVTAWSLGSYVENAGRKAVPGLTVDPVSAGQLHAVTYTFDTTADAAPLNDSFSAVRGGAWKNDGGSYHVQIRIRDTGNPPGEASFTYEVGIDNFAPVADLNHRTPDKVAGQFVDFMGRVLDYRGAVADNTPPQRRIEKVYAWFVFDRTGQYINITNGNLSNTAGNTVPNGVMSAYEGRNATVTKNGNTITNVSFANDSSYGAPGNVTYPATSAGTGADFNVQGGWVREISERTAGPGSDMTWIPTNAWDIQWLFRADTTLMPDGRITLNYVAVDSAGNASFYKQSTIVRNRYPLIERVTLYTDNRGVGAVYTTHDELDASTEYSVDQYRRLSKVEDSLRSLENGYLNSGFISKNKFIGFKVETLFGNPFLHYRLQHVKREGPLDLTLANLQQMVSDKADSSKINLYTIAEHGDYSSANWALLGINENDPPVGAHFTFTPNSVYEEDGSTLKLRVSTTAKVWCYTPVGNLTKTANKGVDGNDNNLPVLPDDVTANPPGDGFNFRGDDAFDMANTAKIREFNGSHPDGGGANDPNNTAFFLIKVWDTVNSDTDEFDQLYDAIVIGMNVYLSDNGSPRARLYDLNPYMEGVVIGNNIGDANKNQTIENAASPGAVGENILRGGLYNANTSREVAKSGHIEPRRGTTALETRYKMPGGTSYTSAPAYGYVTGDTAANTYKDGSDVARDQVSGTVILRGVVWDDQLIRSISVQIGGSSFNGGTAILERDNVSTSPTFGKLIPAANVKAYAIEELHWKTGHTVEWAYVWNTEISPNADGRPAQDVKIWVSAVDHLGNGGTGLSSAVYELNQENETADIFHNTVNVDIAPYIRGFERKGVYATKRSRQGWYSFYQGETDISALGFNLSTGSGAAVSLYNGSATTTLTPTAQTKNRVTFNIPATAVSSRIDLNTGVNNTLALNHRTNDNQSWNREYGQYTEGSELWVNKPYAHIWRSTQNTAAPVTYFGNATGAGGSDNLDRPGMALEYASGTIGRLTGVWAIYGTADSFYGRNDNSARASLYGSSPGEPYRSNDVSFYNGAVANGAVVISYESDGQPTLVIRDGTNFGSAATSVTATSPTPTNRWQNNRVARSAGQSHATSYDSFNRRLQYARKGTAANYAIDGNGITAGGGIAGSANAGVYSDVDYDSTGPVIAYYDLTNDTLRLAYAASEAPAAVANWTRRYVLADTHPLFRGSGTYVSIKVDKANNIHLAFYNSVYKTVVYAVGTRTGTFTAYTVDNVVKGGQWTNISVDDNGNPWIVYADSSRTGNYDGARIAYKSSAQTGVNFTRPLTCPVTGANITGWEAVQMPADYYVMDDRLNIEVWPPTFRPTTGTLGTPTAAVTGTGLPMWNAAIGYASDMYRIAYFYYPNSNVQN